MSEMLQSEVDAKHDADLAYDRADAWARSAKGTPYGSTTPTVEVIDESRIPDVLDPRIMARLLDKSTEVKR